MHVIILLVVVVVLAFDSGVRPFGADGIFAAPWVGAAVALSGPPVALALALLASRPHRDGRHRAVAVRRCDRLLRLGPIVALLVHAFSTLALGWVTAVRAVVGDVVLLDELVAIVPPLLTIVAIWIGTWPVERVVREWTMLRRLDAAADGDALADGLPFERPRLLPHLRHQMRSQMLLVLIPILVAIGASEWGRNAVEAWRPEWAETARPWISLIAVGTALLATPLLVRWALGLRPLPRGELRDDLMGICAAHRVHVREILVWSTGGTMLNGAVIGLVGPLRHVLLTDALLATLSRPMLRAVMAHEIGHVRRHHLPWLAATALGALWVSSLAAWIVVGSIAGVLGAREASPAAFDGDGVGDWVIALEVVIGLVVALLVIGWVSRRFEWQADAFAAAHLSLGGGEQIDAHAVETVSAALETVTLASGGDPAARSWRHGSIRDRQHRLRALAGLPSSRLPIDREVSRLKLAVAAIVVLAVALMLMPIGTPDDGGAYPTARELPRR